MEKHELKTSLAGMIDKKLGAALEEIRNSGIGEGAAAELEKEIIGELQTQADRILVHSVREKIGEELARKALAEDRKEEWVERFSLIFRVQHIVLFVSVILLVFTGLPLKFNESAISKFIFSGPQAFLVAKIAHRIAATMLGGVGLFHLYYIVLNKDGRRNFVQLLPMPRDIKNVVENLKYFMGFSKHPARFDRFSYVEKFDYWAVYWGVVVMVGTGLALWFQEFFLKLMPKYLLDVLKEMHSDEALLATLAIVIWHFYNVHFNPSRFPGTLLWWHGKISIEEMKKEHPLELEKYLKQRVAEQDQKAGDKSAPEGTEPH